MFPYPFDNNRASIGGLACFRNFRVQIEEIDISLGHITTKTTDNIYGVFYVYDQNSKVDQIYLFYGKNNKKLFFKPVTYQYSDEIFEKIDARLKAGYKMIYPEPWLINQILKNGNDITRWLLENKPAIENPDSYFLDASVKGLEKMSEILSKSNYFTKEFYSQLIVELTDDEIALYKMSMWDGNLK